MGSSVIVRFEGIFPLLGAVLATVLALFSVDASALPVFARQTGQNCLACHAGGQFPELTPYGRMFKMTGYTIGARTSVPISVMGVFADSKVANTDKDPDPKQTFAKNGAPLFEGGSVFLGGKVTDNLGAFVQITYNNYNGQAVGASGNNDGRWQGHTAADNMDIRYADRFVNADRDLIIGVSLNNNPSVSDPWNTASAWMQYVPSPSPGSGQFIDAHTPFPGNSTGSNVAGVTAYAYLNKAFYAEVGAYHTANRGLSFMSAGIADADTTKLQGSNNPYWRLAYTHEWGAHNIMIGASGMTAHVFDGSTDPSDSGAYNRVKTTGVDAQYQYLLDPHTITAQAVYQRQKTDLSQNGIAAVAAFDPTFGVFGAPAVDANGNPIATPNTSNTVNIFRAKLSYVYRATYGGAVSYFNQTGTTDSAAMNTVWFDPTAPGVTNDLRAATTGNASGNPATRGMTFEAFWMPIQYVRIGAQYTAYSKFNGASDNYDGLGRNAKDNNSLFFYVWGAY